MKEERRPGTRGRARTAFLLALIGVAVVAAVAVALAMGTAAPGAPAPGGFRILAFNAENLFDGKDDGPEYAEFKVAAGKWSEALYGKRCALTASLVSASCPGGPDLVCLEEIENEAVLARLAAACSPAYPYVALLPSRGSPINCGVMSRYPIVRLAAHAGSDAAKRRLILEAEIDVGGKPLVALVNHWKSKVEGARETEPRRIEEALALASRIRELAAERPGLDVVAAGDFNETPEEAALALADPAGPYPVAFASAGIPRSAASPRASIFLAPPSAAALDALAPALALASAPGAEALVLADPWLAPENAGTGTGSYWRTGGFERIDHFLLSRSLFDGTGFEYAGFEVVQLPFALTRTGKPLEWDGRKGTGYSDHFPILLTLR